MPLDQLVLSKYLFRQGENIFDSAVPMSCGLSLSLFHDSVECLVWTIVKMYDAKPIHNFLEAWDIVAKASGNKCGLELPMKATMKELNTARVSFKHYGILPDSTQVTKFRDYSEAFLKETFQLFFTKDFNSLSLIDAIKNSELKCRLKSAEEAITDNRLVDSIRLFSEVHHIIMEELYRLFPTIDSRIERAGDSIISRSRGSEAQHIRQGINSVLKSISNYYNGMREILFISLFGLSLPDHLRFKRLVPSTFRSAGGIFHHNQFISEDTIKIEDCRFAFDYLVDYALRLESKMQKI